MAENRNQLGVVNAAVFKAAQLYFNRGMRQEEVAVALGVSRASVALYLQRARDAGLVETRLRTEAFRHHELALELERRFDLEAAYVSDNDGDDADLYDDAIKLAADVLSENFDDGDRLGVAWGRTLQRLSELAPNSPRKSATVMQLCGNLGTAFGNAPEESVHAIAKRFGAASRILYAPLVVSTADLANALRREPIIADQIAAFGDCGKAVFSIGDCEENSHIVRCGAVTKPELKTLVKNGARGVVAGRLISADGEPMAYHGGDRVIGVTLENLLEIPFRLAVVVGVEKTEAVLAGLRGGFASHIVLDKSLAEAVVDASEDETCSEDDSPEILVST